MSYFIDRPRQTDPDYSSNEIKPDPNTSMVDLGGHFIGTLGQIWEREKYPNDGTAHNEAKKEKPARDKVWAARKEREAAENRAAQGIAYAEYEKREGHPHPLFAGTVATAEVVDPPVAVTQEHVPASALVKETALVR